MNRRASLAKLLGRSAAKPDATTMPGQTKTTFAPTLTVTTGLDPYQGPWEYEQAAHVLRRCTFSPTRDTIENAVDLGYDDTINALFQTQPLPPPPINPGFPNDPNVPIGQTWINAHYNSIATSRFYRYKSLVGWTMQQMLDEQISIREKLTLFWHNHFSVNDISDPKFLYRYITLIRSSALGNFREFVKEMTIDPTMLRFLNGNQNTNVQPNENYARELLELFTVGKGALAGPGDYSTFTEQDVAAMARVLTGWKDKGFNALAPTSMGSYFQAGKHDTGEKQLSPRFNSAVIGNMGDQEYRHLIDVIFEQDTVARFICRKLYRWFIYYEIDDQTEALVIEPMAQILIDNDYEIQPALEALIRSEHFFDIENIGPMIKNPIDFTISMPKLLGINMPSETPKYYEATYKLFRRAEGLDMKYYSPPGVAGWKAYYQAPQFYRMWINGSTLQKRVIYSDIMAVHGYDALGTQIKVEPLDFVNTVSDPMNPNTIIDEFAHTLFPRPISDSQKLALKNILISGLPDFEWTVEYSAYTSDPDNVNLANAVRLKLRNLIRAMVQMPEFYLC